MDTETKIKTVEIYKERLSSATQAKESLTRLRAERVADHIKELASLDLNISYYASVETSLSRILGKVEAETPKAV